METAPEQLSFDQLIDNEDQTEKLALIPYTDYHLINAKKFSFPQRRFFVLSIAIHVVFAVYAISIVIEKLKKPDVIEVSFESPTPATATQASYSQPEPPAVETIKPPELEKLEPVVITKSKVAPKAVHKPTFNSAAKSAPKAVAAIIPARSTKPAASTFKAEPLATVSDIEVPALTAVNNEENSHLSLKEIENDFDKIDRSQNEKLLAAAKDDSKMMEDSISDLDAVSKNVSEEESGLEDLAAERLRNLSAQKAELKKAAAASAGPAVTHTNVARAGKTNNVGSEQNSEAKGASTGIGSESEGIVRRLEDLRQKPGNPRPDYDVNDRMNGLSGTIIINAYVTKDGSLTLFRMIQSTGHRNLDRKTLSALKDWKFYPGQEGWVELPFKWDLKGGVQQKPTLLKRR